MESLDNSNPSLEGGPGEKVQATSIEESSGGSSPLASTMKRTPTSADTAQALTPREDNRPPPTPNAPPVTTQSAPGPRTDTATDPAGPSNGEQQPPLPSSQSREPQKTTENSSHIETLEPYVLPRLQSSYRGRGNNRRRTNQNRNNSNRIVPSYPPLVPETTDTKRFFIIKGPENVKLWMDIDTISANQELIKSLRGRPKRVSELRGGDILVEVASKEQSDRIRQLKKLDGCTVSVLEHKYLNSTKGTIHSKRFCDLDDETLLADLAKDHVTEIYRIKRREGDNFTNTGTMILTFANFALPEKVSIGWTTYDVREYIPNPRRCFKCQRYGHGSKACHSQDDRCANCGEFGHMDRDCSNPTNCCNCEGDHPSYSKKCQTYLMEKEILTVMTKEKILYPEAKKKLGFTSPPRRSYASVATQNENNTSNRRIRTNQEEITNPTESINTSEINPNPTNNQLPPSTPGGTAATEVAAAATKATTPIVAPKAAIAEGGSDPIASPPVPQTPISNTPPLQKKQAESNSKRKVSSPAASCEKTEMEPPPKKPSPKDKDKNIKPKDTDRATKPKDKLTPSPKMEVDTPYRKIPTTYSMRH